LLPNIALLFEGSIADSHAYTTPAGDDREMYEFRIGYLV
jgi:hypothetical protein